ncbi:hypothetical protein [Neisseria iguanae]|uniref:hypothetical protein n=1 Tax=Neisseria iguanae TaxID=90242 RepID=UPI0011B1CE2C|nr:hypothetical protein [Neisseria iguanae]
MLPHTGLFFWKVVALAMGVPRPSERWGYFSNLPDGLCLSLHIDIDNRSEKYPATCSQNKVQQLLYKTITIPIKNRPSETTLFQTACYNPSVPYFISSQQA